MRRHLSGSRGALTATLVATAVLFCSAISFAGTPTLGPDCGTNSSVVGSDSAGKATLGIGTSNTCTLTFSIPYTNAPACITTNETQGRAVGVSSTQSTAVLSGPYPFAAGDTITYLCAEY
jgi:hypothetical protein